MRRVLGSGSFQPVVVRMASGVRSGAAIANAAGVPGTLGFFALTRHDHRLVAVTSHHVLFGAGAREDDPVWLIRGARGFARLGRAAYGRAGSVQRGSRPVWVDAAVVTLDDVDGDAVEAIGTEAGEVTVGARVTKVGGESGATLGVIADVDSVGTTTARAGQILVRSATRAGAFCVPGDSGAAVRNDRGEIVGVLCGVTAGGDGIACPIAPVLDVLHLRIARVDHVMPRGGAW